MRPPFAHAGQQSAWDESSGDGVPARCGLHPITLFTGHCHAQNVSKRIQGGSSTLRDTRYEQLSEIVKRNCTLQCCNLRFNTYHRQKFKRENFAVEPDKVNERECYSVGRTCWGQLFEMSPLILTCTLHCQPVSWSTSVFHAVQRFRPAVRAWTSTC
jgi:hypothetical protein